MTWCIKLWLKPVPPSHYMTQCWLAVNYTHRHEVWSKYKYFQLRILDWKKLSTMSMWMAWVYSGCLDLTHWGRVTHICVGNLTIIGSDSGLSAPSHYLNQCWNIVNWTPRNKLQWNVYRNSYIFIQENPFENVVWKMVAILSRPQCVNSLATGDGFQHHESWSILVQVMALCLMAPSHYLNQCWLIVA